MAEEKWLKIPYFAKGSVASLERELTTGQFADGLDKALFYFATDTKQWILVDIDKTIHTISGYNSDEHPEDGVVKRVDSLPSMIDADPNVLYIVDKVVYSFDGHAFYPTYQELYDKVIGVFPENMTILQYIDETVNSALLESKQYTDDEVASLKQYTDDEITNLKDYTDSEINDTRQHIDDGVDEAKTYTDEQILGIRNYTDISVDVMRSQAVSDANQYTDEQLGLRILQGGEEDG